MGNPNGYKQDHCPAMAGKSVTISCWCEQQAATETEEPPMRMAALSGASGIPVATIKFYLREGLLHAGERTSPNQSQYDTTHVHRLRLIRALTEVGGLSIMAAGELLATIDNPELPMHQVFGIAQGAVRLPISQISAQDLADGSELLDKVISDRGWQVADSLVARADATRVVGTMRALGLEHSHRMLDSYARAAEIVAKADMDSVQAVTGRDAKVETVVAGTVLGDVLLAALRRIAQADYSSAMFGEATAGPPGAALPPAN